MKHLFIILTSIAFLFGSIDSMAITKAKSSNQIESLQYDVFYHWGIIWKKAGHGKLNLYEETAQDGSIRMHGHLNARTLSFIEYIMAVRDTLDTYYSPNYVPIEFAKLTNEGSYKAIERNYYTHKLNDGSELIKSNVDSTFINITRWRNKKGSDKKNYSVKGVGHDMLSAFYMVRGLDFSTMKPGTKITFPVFAGIKMQMMTVVYQKEENCKLRNGKTMPAYKCTMAINAKGEDGAPLYVWFSKDKAHRPLSVIIELHRIGAIQCEIAE